MKRSAARGCWRQVALKGLLREPPLVLGCFPVVTDFCWLGFSFFCCSCFCCSYFCFLCAFLMGSFVCLRVSKMFEVFWLFFV